MSTTAVLVANAAATWFMTGLIWMVQVVHYPLFSHADRAAYPAFADAHSRLITPVVGPAMLVELATALWLVQARPAAFPARWAWVGAGLVGVIWLSTAFVQVPLHGQLGSGYDARVHSALVATNWVRTVAWSLRAILMGWVLVRALQSGG
ncbi:hypothetical protein TBR22_A05610 [Luteitalea sp. TBR-22]|uniref:hypothetical protein n=1 Tax=Luteitalea sp. TBR-22 TaxID=2802971 RepID=UPI001AF05576|nr:hypothetical protein [Luteitalea sp. TBR-22]BCS31361.1 hypothetical protein TBR22_A05610 [Luteitalea sp. TBR-22]